MVNENFKIIYIVAFYVGFCVLYKGDDRRTGRSKRKRGDIRDCYCRREYNYCKKGTPVEFSFAGEPDFITFYSGELGHQYIYRQRVENEESDIVSSKLKFNIYQEGTSYAESTGRYTNCIDVFYAFSDPENGVEGFPGLSKIILMLILRWLLISGKRESGRKFVLKLSTIILERI